MKTYVADLQIAKNSTMTNPECRNRERAAPPSTRTRTNLDDDSRVPRSSQNSGSENFWVETRSTTVHHGFRGLPYTLSKLGTAHIGRWGGGNRPREEPRSTRNQFVIFCIFPCLFPGKGGLVYKGGRGVPSSLAPPCGTIPTWGVAPRQGAPALVGPKWPTRGAALLFLFPFYFFSPNGPLRPI